MRKASTASASARRASPRMPGRTPASHGWGTRGCGGGARRDGKGKRVPGLLLFLLLGLKGVEKEKEWEKEKEIGPPVSPKGGTRKRVLLNPSPPPLSVQRHWHAF